MCFLSATDPPPRRSAWMVRMNVRTVALASNTQTRIDNRVFSVVVPESQDLNEGIRNASYPYSAMNRMIKPIIW